MIWYDDCTYEFFSCLNTLLLIINIFSRDRTYSLVGFRIKLKYRPLEALLVHYLPAFLLVIFLNTLLSSRDHVLEPQGQKVKEGLECQNWGQWPPILNFLYDMRKCTVNEHNWRMLCKISAPYLHFFKIKGSLYKI